MGLSDQVRVFFFEEHRRQELRFSDGSVVSVGVLAESDDFLSPPSLATATYAEGAAMQRRFLMSVFARGDTERRWRVLVMEGPIRGSAIQPRRELYNELFESRDAANAAAFRKCLNLVRAKGQEIADPAEAPWRLKMSAISWIAFACLGLFESAALATLIAGPQALELRGLWSLWIGLMAVGLTLCTGVGCRILWLRRQRRRAVHIYRSTQISEP
ncbi:MAG: hypothetical protein WC054_08995 [Candidatus Nanopelagicales bacterium]